MYISPHFSRYSNDGVIFKIGKNIVQNILDCQLYLLVYCVSYKLQNLKTVVLFSKHLLCFFQTVATYDDLGTGTLRESQCREDKNFSLSREWT